MQNCKDNSAQKSRVSEWLWKPSAARSWYKVKNGGGNLTSQGIIKKKSPQEAQPQGNLVEETRVVLRMKVRMDQLKKYSSILNLLGNKTELPQ